jgi:hypothetical protein
MKRISLTMPQLAFIVATRAALAAGFALLISRRMGTSQKNVAAAALVGLGAVTTVSAATLVFKNRGPLRRRLRILTA